MKNPAGFSERSIVTVLVVDTVDSTGHVAGVDPDEAQELLDRIFAHLNRAVAGAGGLFVSYSGDGGLAVFGWPRSLEDHADRACEAAWQIQQAAASTKPLRNSDGRQVHFRIGIHSGLVSLRWLKLDARTGIDTVGGAVHLAAALQKIAPPDRILLSSKTLELCKSELKLAPHEAPPTLKKVHAQAYQLCAQPIRPTGKDAFRKYQHPFVGRAAEREALRSALRGAENCTAAIIGEPGIGKSRLAGAAIDDVLPTGVSVLAFNGDSQKRATPYSAMRSLILETLSLGEAASDAEIVNSLGVAGSGDAMEPVAAALLARGVEADPKSRRLTQTQVARALIETFERLTKDKPILIVIEDLQLLDPESVLCLRLMAKAKSSGRRALLLTGRPEAIKDAKLIAETIVHLDALPRKEMIQFARQLWPGAAPRQAVLEKALERADGIPFVLEQIVLSLGVDDTNSINLFPETVQSVIHARLNRLSAGGKSFAQALSVLGEEVDVDLASKTLRIGGEALRRNRSELERLEIIHRATWNSIRFRHTIVAEACAETVPGPRRQEIHRAAIDAITSIHGDLGTQYERLAYHAEGARDDERALEYLWLAALRARRSSASGSLSLTFRRAIQCTDRMGASAESRFVDFVTMAFAPLLQTGEFKSLGACLPRAMELAREQKRGDKVCILLCHMGMLSWFEGRYAEGRVQCEEALEIATDLGSLPLIFGAKLMLVSVLHGIGDMRLAIALLLELRDTLSGKLETARLGAAAIPASAVRSYLCWFLAEVGRCEEGLLHGARGLEIARTEGEPYSEVLSLLGLARNFIQLRRDHDAVESLELANALIERNGYDTPLPDAIGLLATALARSGEPQRAVSIVEAWFARGEEERTGRLQLFSVEAGYAEALFRSGDAERSLAAVERALAIGYSIGNPSLLVQGLGLRACLQSEVSPRSPQIEQDLAEQQALCLRHGLAARW
jgi:class 3 adenylate cyclase/tetratricopeptide (TPR) repeat protein